MIQLGEKGVSAFYLGRIAIGAIYKGATLVWQAISSCFGGGWWKGDEPWNGSDAWNGGFN